MNLSEFKAWFEGFTDGMESNPSEKQWAKIKEKVSTITPDPTTPIVLRQYWHDYNRWYDRQWWGGQPYAGGIGINTVMAQNSARLTAAAPAPDFTAMMTGETGEDGGTVFAPMVEATFRAMGAADAASLQ